MATLRKDNVIFTLITKLDEANKGLGDIDNKVGGLQATFAKAGKAFSGIIAAGAVAAAVGGIAKVTRAALDQAAAFEQTTVSYNTLIGDVKKSAELVKSLETFSVVTPFTPEEVIQAGKTMLAFGVDAESVADNLANLGEASAATGGDLNNLAYIFGQARATGVLFTQDLNQLANAGLPILSLLADEMGEAEENIRGLASEGRITFPILQRAFARAAQEGGRFAGALEAQSQTLEGLKSTAEGVRNAFFRAFGQRILEPAKEFQRVMIKLWEAARDFVAVGVADELAQERSELNVLVGRITDANTEQETRNTLIGDLQRQYPDFLKNLDAETATNAELRDRLVEVNEQYRLKIIQANLNEEEAEAVDDLARAIGNETDALSERQRIINNIVDGGEFLSNLSAEQIALLKTKESAEDFIETLDSMLDARQQDETFTGRQLTTLQNLNKEIANSRKEQEELQKVVANVQRRSDQITTQLGIEAPEVKPDGKPDGAKEVGETLAEAIAESFGAEYQVRMDDMLGEVTDEIFRSFLRRQGYNTSTIPLLEALGVSREALADLPEEFRKEIEAILNPVQSSLFEGLVPELPTPTQEEEAGPTLAEKYQELGDALYDVDSIAQGFFNAEVARTQQLISLQEDRVRKALRTAERGNAEQLQLEEDRLNELLEKREQAAARQRQLDAIQIIAANAVTAAQSAKAVATGFAEGNIIGGIATVVSLAASIGAIILAVNNAFTDLPAFDVGTEYLDSDMTARVHKGERILTAEQNAAMGQIPNSDVPGLVNEGIAARMDRTYLYEQNREMLGLLGEQVYKTDQLIDAVYGDAARMGKYFRGGGRRGRVSRVHLK